MLIQNKLCHLWCKKQAHKLIFMNQSAMVGWMEKYNFASMKIANLPCFRQW